MTARSTHRIPARRSRVPAQNGPRKLWAEVLRTDFRDARVHALVGGVLEVHRCVASVRPDGWVEFSGPDDETPQKELVTFNRLPKERVQLVEWLPDNFADLDAPAGARFRDFVPARVEAMVCGRYTELRGTVSERGGAWLDVRPQAPWRLGPEAPPNAEVEWISLPPQVVHRVQYLLR